MSFSDEAANIENTLMGTSAVLDDHESRLGDLEDRTAKLEGLHAETPEPEPPPPPEPEPSCP